MQEDKSQSIIRQGASRSFAPDGRHLFCQGSLSFPMPKAKQTTKLFPKMHQVGIKSFIMSHLSGGGGNKGFRQLPLHPHQGRVLNLSIPTGQGAGSGLYDNLELQQRCRIGFHRLNYYRKTIVGAGDAVEHQSRV